LQWRAPQRTQRERTPLSRMLPRVIGSNMIFIAGNRKTMTKQSQVPLSTIVSFAEHLTEMLHHLQDVPEFKKRHSASLIRLRDGMAKLLDS
jgi:hypothetical protein